MRISIFGLGYVGCVTAGCLAEEGHQVLGVDILPAKVNRLAAGLSTVVEPGLEDLIAEGHRRGRIEATQDAQRAVLDTDVSLICVGTPSRHDGSLDVRAVRGTAQTIGRALRAKRGRHLVVLRSTVPAGTTEWIARSAIPSGAPGVQHSVVVVPEFLREGSAIADYRRPPLVVVGGPEAIAGAEEAALRGLFEKGEARIHWVRYREAEMLKALCNTYHALKVVFANEAAALCSRLSVDGHVVMGLLAEDRKLNASGAYLRPGLPFGGSCLPKDLRMLTHLAGRAGSRLPLLSSVMASNQAHLERLIERIHHHGQQGRRKVGLDGLSFKAKTDDLRESPMVLVAENLIGKGYDLRIYDPDVELSRVSGANREYIEKHLPHLSSRLVSSVDELLQHSELLVLTRDGDAILNRAAVLGKYPLVVDLTGRDRRARRSREVAARPSRSERRKLIREAV